MPNIISTTYLQDHVFFSQTQQRLTAWVDAFPETYKDKFNNEPKANFEHLQNKHGAASQKNYPSFLVNRRITPLS